MIYLDHAATSMNKPPEVAEAVLYAMKHCASLGRSGHNASVRAGRLAFDCRVEAADFFDAGPEQVVFTANATHGLNIAIHSLVKPGDRVVISGFEHNAVTRPLYHLGAEIITAGTRLFAPQDTVTAFAEAITPQTKAVICTHVSNVFGYVLPVEEIAEICRKRKVPLVLDAAQSAGVLPISLKQLGASFIAMPGHKGLLGPQGTGLLLCNQEPKPLLCGGTGSNSLDWEMPAFLPDSAEVGTHNVPGIAGLLAGLRYLDQIGIQQVWKQEQHLLKYLYDLIWDIPGVRCFRGPEQWQTGVLSIQIQGFDCENAAKILADNGIAVRAGLHCAPLAHASAHTLEQGTVRFSVSHTNTEKEIEFAAEIVKGMIP